MDTSGYVILPVESPPIPVDAAPAERRARPHEKLQITQSLDERQAKDGKLILEIKATARGLVPELDTILDVQPPGLRDREDRRPGPLGAPSSTPRARPTWSTRSGPGWSTSGALPSRTRPPKTFKFARAKADGAEMVYQRYVDADLAKVGPEVSLEARYGEPTYAWAWWLGGGLLLAALAVGALVALVRSRPRHVKAARFQLPEEITPFSVLGLLREIEHKNGLSAPEMQELCHLDPAARATLLRRPQRQRAGPQGDRRDLDRKVELRGRLPRSNSIR